MKAQSLIQRTVIPRVRCPLDLGSCSTAKKAARRNYALHSSSQTPPRRKAAIPPYQKILRKFEEVRRILRSQKLTLAEKILYSHLDNPAESLLTNTNDGRNIRGNANLKLKPD